MRNFTFLGLLSPGVLPLKFEDVSINQKPNHIYIYNFNWAKSMANAITCNNQNSKAVHRRRDVEKKMKRWL